ncbi:MAG: ATP-binding cassette domain-containing protein [Anaerolineae bacterium]|nr:ATP-binding cassette domain-containing protein [Anaerolineae bacterium]
MLRTEQLSYHYLGEQHGLDPLSLAIAPGEMVLVSGPSGCGKSTLARCLSGLIPHLYKGHLQGQVWVDTLATHNTPLWRLSEHVGLVFQNPASQMLASTVEDEILFGLENLGLPRRTIADRLEETLCQFGLDNLVARSPLALSGGEQQKVALAATMARRPPTLVLDEPLSMLDATAAEELVTHLDGLAENGTTIVVCEHRTEPFAASPGLRAVELGNGVCDTRDIDATAFPVGGGEPFALEVSGLGVQLAGRSILHDLSFSVESGQIVAIIGRNGVGKTTLLRALAGLQRHSGTATVGGRQPDLALVFQNPDWQLFSATVRDEILFKIPNPDMARYRWLLDVLGLCDHENAQPLLLSEGQKKRVALATALMRTPRHGVLLDEPSLGQDAEHKTKLVRLARALAKAGRLVIITTHDLSLARHADRLMLLDRDGLVADGPTEKIWDDRSAWGRIGLHVPQWALEAM